MSTFTITSYFTIGTPYAEEAHRYLMPTISKLNLKSDIRGIMGFGTWQKNTSYKPKFIREALDRHSENLIFVDCDAEILEYPSLFDNIPEEYGFAAHILDKNEWYGYDYGKNRYELLSGTLFIRNNESAKAILDEWIQRCENSTTWEQQVFQTLLKDKNIPIFNLPISYCWIKTLPNGNPPLVKCENPIIVHHQVSRKYKGKKL